MDSTQHAIGQISSGQCVMNAGFVMRNRCGRERRSLDFTDGRVSKEKGNTEFRLHNTMNGVWTGNGSRDIVYYETLGWWHVYEPQFRKS